MAILHLDSPVGGEEAIDCAEVRIVGDVAWAVPEEGEQTVVPLANVTGVVGDDVGQEIEEVEFPGGRVTELVTHVS